MKWYSNVVLWGRRAQKNRPGVGHGFRKVPGNNQINIFIQDSFSKLWKANWYFIEFMELLYWTLVGNLRKWPGEGNKSIIRRVEDNALGLVLTIVQAHSDSFISCIPTDLPNVWNHFF